jgi:alkylation response protein AidB-like acyl-CoA dehydrogenase
MMTHTGDDRQQAILREARDFVRDVLLPRAGEFDREERLPREVINELARRGYTLASVPEKHGGLGLDPVPYGLLTEEIGKGCCSSRSLMTVQSSLVGETLSRWGTDEQRARWLMPMAREGKLGAFGLTEPEVGSDAKAVRTTYRKSGQGYVINGRKKWTSFGGIADFFVVIAKGDSEITAFIVERDAEGVEVSTQRGLLGNRAVHVAQLSFSNVRVPEDQVIGKPGSGFAFVVNTALDHGRYSIAWGGVAIAQAALESMVDYARTRKQFGRRIAQHQLVQRMLGRAVANTHAARALCLAAGEMRQRGDPDAAAETTVAKYFASKVAVDTTSDAVQVHGGDGCWDRYPAERLYREAKIMEIIEGTSQMQEQIIARHGLRKYRTSPPPERG